MLPIYLYHYDKNIITNLLLFAKLADEHYIVYNTRVDDVIYVQSKDDEKYLQFKKDPKYYGLYNVDISKEKFDGHCYLTLLRRRNYCFPYLIKNKPKQLES